MIFLPYFVLFHNNHAKQKLLYVFPYSFFPAKILQWLGKDKVDNKLLTMEMKKTFFFFFLLTFLEWFFHIQMNHYSSISSSVISLVFVCLAWEVTNRPFSTLQSTVFMNLGAFINDIKYNQKTLRPLSLNLHKKISLYILKVTSI